MKLTEYQQKCLETSACEKGKSNIVDKQVLVLGLCGEAGEVAELFKKHYGHGHPLDPEKLTLELGDVLWYLSTLASEYGISLETIAQKKIDKLRSRYPNGFSSENSLNREEENA